MKETNLGHPAIYEARSLLQVIEAINDTPSPDSEEMAAQYAIQAALDGEYYSKNDIPDSLLFHLDFLARGDVYTDDEDQTLVKPKFDLDEAYKLALSDIDNNEWSLTTQENRGA